MRWRDLGEILEPLPWAVVGAVATRLYMPERGTADLDIMVGSDDIGEVETRLMEAGWQRTGDLAVGGSSWVFGEGPPLDVLVCDETWCVEALTEAQANRDAHGLPIVPLPYLVLLKLRSGRVVDMADLTRMLGLADDKALGRVRDIVRALTPEDADDLEALIELGKLETEGRPE